MTIRKMISLLAFLCIGFSSYGQKNPASELKKLSWLQGTWNRTNNKPGQTGFESWAIDASGKFYGKGVTMRGTDTAFVEKLTIMSRDGNIYYVADVTGNQAPVYFRFTEFSSTGFVCENQENDFPKKIAYYMGTDGNLKASISGGGKTVDYLFIKKVDRN